MARQQWMQLTHGGYTSIRSKELKAIDESLAKYHKTKSSIEKDVLTAALLKWMQLKGPAWKQSVRNKHQAVEILYSQITGLADRHLTGREIVALSHLRSDGSTSPSELIQQSCALGLEEAQLRSRFMTEWPHVPHLAGGVSRGATSFLGAAHPLGAHAAVPEGCPRVSGPMRPPHNR